MSDDILESVPAVGLYAAVLAILAAVAALAIWAGHPHSTSRTLHDSSGGTWHCMDAGIYQNALVVHCDGQERLDPTRNDGVRCFLVGEDGVACYNLRGGTKDLTRG